MYVLDVLVETVANTLLGNISDKQNDLPVETDVDTRAEETAGRVSADVDAPSQDLMDMEPGNNLTSEWNTELSTSGSKNDNDLLEKYDKILPVDVVRQVDYGLDQNPDVPTQSKNEKTLPQLSTSGSENENLLEKYDNNKILPVDIVWQVDRGLNPDTDAPIPPESKKTLLDTNTKDDVNLSYDSDDTILLEEEIAEAIGDQASDQGNNELSRETEATSDTNTITNQLANVRINNGSDLPVETPNIPISPNKGKVVIKSYRLHRGATNETENAETTRTDQENAENEVLHLNVPTGKATRPPSPNKYKIRKFQIDKVRYYSCTYCNKHFESIHYLNNHHRKRHPPVTCDVCGKLYDTPNSLIRHSYRHLDGQHKCKDCEQSFHFKSELTSHSMKHATERLHCKQCDKSFI